MSMEEMRGFSVSVSGNVGETIVDAFITGGFQISFATFARKLVKAGELGKI